MILRWLKGEKRPTLAERGDPPPGEDPVRRILAVVRGPARLDMFEETLGELSPGTHGHRGVALAFHRELASMAEMAGVDLTLLKRRVEACAEALVAAGETERAGELLSQIGKKGRAAELFVSAGAIDKLEEAHYEIESLEGGDRWEARLAFEQFEARFVVGMREEALKLLERAVQKWPANAVYREVLENLSARLSSPMVLELSLPHGSVTLLKRWPLVIGRGEDAALRLKSPLLSRAHAEIGLVDGVPYLRQLSDKGPVEVDGQRLSAPRRLEGEQQLKVAGVGLRCLVSDDAVELVPDHDPNRRCFGVKGRGVRVLGLGLRFDEQGRPVLEKAPGVKLGKERVLHDTLLLIDDEVQAEGQERAIVVG